MLNYTENTEHKSQYAQLETQWFNGPDVDVPLLNSLIIDNSELGADAVLEDTKFNPLLSPFEMQWTFGFEVSVPVINLTIDHRTQIFFSAANVGILYDYCTKNMVHLKGHRNKITGASTDRSARWLATIDNGKEKQILIWDIQRSSIVWTIFDYPGNGYDLYFARLSPNARLLITVTNENSNTVDFWLWTYGEEKPNDSYTDDRDLGAAKAVEFHPNKEEHLMVVFEKAVLFFLWDYQEKKATNLTSPRCPLTSSIGHYTDGTYVDLCHECFIASSKGCILVFGNTIYAKNYVREELDNQKMYVKSIKISKYMLNCITSCDELIVVGDTNGTVMFLDKQVKLLYWYSRAINKPIKSISFERNPRKFVFDSSTPKEVPSGTIHACHVDRSEEFETLMLKKIPQDATLKNRPFVTRDFFLTTVDGLLYVMNFANQEFVPLFPASDSCVAAIDVHYELPYIVVGYAKGRIIIFNYLTHEEVISTILPSVDDDIVISSIKYSPQSLHLACGRSNGELWILEPAILAEIYVEPFKFSDDRVVKIAFSQTSLQMAYYDATNTVFGFYYDTETEDWVFKGKIRSHYKDICNILFLDEDPYGLFTVGKDRHLIRYTDLIPKYFADWFVRLTKTNFSDKELDILSRDRIEQKDIPLFFISHPKRKFSKGGYFLVADDKHKYKIINNRTTMCSAVYLGPSYGCYREHPVCKMEFLPNYDKKYLIFMTKSQIGIQLLPIDGNPFKYVGTHAHPDELLDFRLSYDGKNIFTIGKNDRTVFMWKVNTVSVETMHMLGGVELQPFFCLLEGGRNGFLYQEMRDLFYYMKILQEGEQICAPREVGNSINIGELPDLMRACGYYPSEYEIENLLTDARYKDFDESGVLKEKVTFCEFVKLFINHKPAYGYSLQGVSDAFETVTIFSEEDKSTEMSRKDFIEAVTTTGEQVSNEQIFKCLTMLLPVDVSSEQNGERDFSFMPDTIDCDFLLDDILGLDMDEIERMREEDDAEDDDDDDGGNYYYYR